MFYPVTRGRESGVYWPKRGGPLANRSGGAGDEEEKGREVKRGKLGKGAGRRMRVGLLELAGEGAGREAGAGGWEALQDGSVGERAVP